MFSSDSIIVSTPVSQQPAEVVVQGEKAIDAPAVVKETEGQVKETAGKQGLNHNNVVFLNSQISSLFSKYAKDDKTKKQETEEESKVEVLDEKEAQFYIQRMIHELSGLKTETELYRKAVLIRQLSQNEFLKKDVHIEADLLHPDNYIEAYGEIPNGYQIHHSSRIYRVCPQEIWHGKHFVFS